MNLPQPVPPPTPTPSANAPAALPGPRRSPTRWLYAVLRFACLSLVACLTQLAEPSLSAADAPPATEPAPAPAPAPVPGKPGAVVTPGAEGPPAPAPTPKPAGANQPPQPKPKPEPKPTPPVLIPDNLPNGKAIVHFYLYDDITVTKLMIYNQKVYGFDDDELVEYETFEVKGFEANGRCEVLTAKGQLPVPAQKALWRDSMFYFQLDGGSHMLIPERDIAALFPPDRFRIYPWVFNKYIAPWGKIYDQRPFYIQFDFGYVQFQNLQRTEWANAHLQIGSDVGLWRNHLEGAANYGTVDRQITTNNQSGEIKFDRYLSNYLYAYLKSGVFHDDVNFIFYRLTNGFGFGLGTFQQNNLELGLFGWMIYSHKLDVELGIDRIDEDNRDGYQVGWYGRTAIIDKLVLADGVDFDNRFEYQSGLISRNRENRGQYFIHYRSELRLRLIRGVSIRLAYNFDYNSRPVKPTPPDSHQIALNLSFRYGQ